MVRFAGWILVAVMAGVGVAHASRHEQWNAVERLGVDIPVEVRSVGQAGVEECRVVRVDDAALTCQREPDPNADWGPGDNARLVFPRETVQGVWVMVTGEPWSVGKWIAVGASVAIIVLDSVGGGAFGAFIAGTVVAMAWFVCEITIPSSPPRPKRMHRQLVYRSATP
jgi:hypothetical protein